MMAIIASVLLSGLALLVIISVGIGVYNSVYSEISENICKIAIVILCIASVILITMGLTKIEKNENKKWVIKYESTKKMIEDSLENDKLSGLERVNLVNQAIQENKELISQQVDYHTWYGYAISKKVLELELINFD